MRFFNMLMGAGFYGCVTGLYELAVAYETVGYGLNPVICLWAGGILIAAMTAYVWQDLI